MGRDKRTVEQRKNEIMIELKKRFKTDRIWIEYMSFERRFRIQVEDTFTYVDSYCPPKAILKAFI